MIFQMALFKDSERFCPIWGSEESARRAATATWHGKDPDDGHTHRFKQIGSEPEERCFFCGIRKGEQHAEAA